MKTFYLILLLTALNFKTAGQWTVQQFNPGYNTAFFLLSTNSSTGFAAGENGIIRRTTDKGQTWTNIYSGTTEEISSVKFGILGDTLKGYAVGDNGLILKTTNKGVTWVQQLSGISTDIHDAAIGRGDTAIACSNSGIILRTTNGGQNWSSQVIGGGTSAVYSVYRYSFSEFYAVDGIGRVFKSGNAGAGWNQYSSSTSNALFNITSSALVYISCGHNGTIIRSTNSGVNWTTIPTGISYGLSDVLGNAGEFLISSYDGSVLRSTTQGQSFSVAAAPNYIPLNSIEYSSDFGDVIALGESGVLRFSTDYGATWPVAKGGTPGQINSISFPSPLTGYCAASSGGWFKTTNGGGNWMYNNIGVFDNTSVDFVNNNTGWMTAQNTPGMNNGEVSYIYRTTNGGTNWANYQVVNLREIHSIDFVDASTGWCLGSNEVNDGTTTYLFKSTNGGAGWSLQYNSNVRLNDLCFLNSLTGWAAADNGNLARTTNGGANWNQVNTPTGASYNSITFVSQTQGYACGINGTIIATSNSGQTWVQQTSGVTDILYSVHFGSSSNGVCTGNNGARLRTTNGGQTWLLNREEADIEIGSCFMPTPQNAYAAGSFCYIANFGGIVTGIETISNNTPMGFLLEQNYPNPFNPTTHLRFEISELRFVKLMIYDILGREAASLVNENLQPGTYEVKFDGSSYPSGVYFYKLTIYQGGSSIGCYSETKKMILVK